MNAFVKGMFIALFAFILLAPVTSAHASYPINHSYVMNHSGTDMYVLMRSASTNALFWQKIYNGHGSAYGAEGYDIPPDWRLAMHSYATGANWRTNCGYTYPYFQGEPYGPVIDGHSLEIWGFEVSPSDGC